MIFESDEIYYIGEDEEEYRNVSEDVKKLFTEKPVVRCQYCQNDYNVSKESDFYKEMIETVKYYPPTLHFDLCCQECREGEASHFDTCILFDNMIEYMVVDKEWFRDELTLEKRWGMTHKQVQERANELRKKLPYIL